MKSHSPLNALPTAWLIATVGCALAMTHDAFAAVRLWDGGGLPATNWSVAANWEGDVAPSGGDDVVFPAGAMGSTNFNDLAVGVSSNSITIGGGGFMLRGVTPLALTLGVVCTNDTGNNTILFPLIVAGSAFVISNAAGGSLALNGALDLNGGDASFACGGGMVMFGVITNAGGINKSGPGSLQLSQANTYDGATAVWEGRLTVLHDRALGSADTGTLVSSGAELQIFGGRSMSEPLRLAGTLSSGLSVTNAWTGGIMLMDPNAAIAVNSGGMLVVGGLMEGTAGFHKTLGGALLLKSDNTYAGITFVDAGILFLNASQPSTDIHVAPGGILRGVGGQSGAVTNRAFGSIQPGDDFELSTLHFGGGFTGVPFSEVRLRIADASTFDRLSVNGDVDLGGGLLQMLLLSSPPPAGGAFQIIDNDGSDAISGTFAALPEGGVLSLGGVAFQITYRGGDGNDVVLTRVSEPTMITSITSLTNGFKQIVGLGLPNVGYVLEAAPDLDAVPIKWEPIATNAAAMTGVYLFIDQDVGQFPMRFYRVLTP